MNKESILKSIKALKEKSKKRAFSQSYDLIIALKGLDMKKPDNQVDFFMPLKFGTGKDIKVCALIGRELTKSAKEICDYVISDDEFNKYAKDRKAVKKLANECDFFIAQANVMPKVATAFGRILGPKGKMPNPKIGCIVPPNANLKPLCEKLRKTIRINAKIGPFIQCIVGKEDMKDDEAADNIFSIYDNLIHHLIGGKNNIKEVYLKLTMSKPVRLGK